CSSRNWRSFGEAAIPSSPTAQYCALALFARLNIAAKAAPNRILFKFFIFFVSLTDSSAGYHLIRQTLENPSRLFSGPAWGIRKSPGRAKLPVTPVAFLAVSFVAF